MPSSVNGIGTHYYGKKNKSDRRATCQYCAQVTKLETFETRLWFVFLLIPIFPFGRKRIVDQCTSCSYHLSIPVKQWETGRQSDTANALEYFRKEPSESSALDVHESLLRYQEFQEATEFRETVLEQFKGKPLIRAGLARHMEQIGLIKEADVLWDEAAEIAPDAATTVKSRLLSARSPAPESKVESAPPRRREQARRKAHRKTQGVG